MKRFFTKTTIASFLVGSSILLAGCGGAPSCDDSDVLDVVKNIIRENAPKYADAKFKFSSFMTESKDDDKKQVVCKASVNVQKTGANTTKWIDYEARYTDDDMVYVSITNFFSLDW